MQDNAGASASMDLRKFEMWSSQHLYLLVILSSTIYNCKAVPAFTKVPGLKKVCPMQAATLTWSFNDDLTSSSLNAIKFYFNSLTLVYVRKDYSVFFDCDDKPTYPNTCTYQTPATLILPNFKEQQAGSYICNIEYKDEGVVKILNDTSILEVYGACPSRGQYEKQELAWKGTTTFPITTGQILTIKKGETRVLSTSPPHSDPPVTVTFLQQLKSGEENQTLQACFIEEECSYTMQYDAWGDVNNYTITSIYKFPAYEDSVVRFTVEVNVLEFAQPLTGSKDAIDSDVSWNVTCQVYAKPEANIWWTYNGVSVLPTSVQNTSRTEGANHGSGVYLVTSTLTWKHGSDVSRRKEAAGMYRCYSGHSATGEINSQDLKLNVQYSPIKVKVSSSTLTLVESNSLSVSCSADCNPPCYYTWTGPDITPRQGGQLNITEVKRTNQGTYICTASNGIGTDGMASASVTVNYPPEVMTANRVEGLQGSPVALGCYVQAQPPASVAWYNSSDPNTPLVTSTPDTNLTLRINSSDCTHTGQYECAATNRPDSTATDVTKRSASLLNIQCPARVYQTSPVDRREGAAEGDSTSFVVYVIANPVPQFVWTFRFSNGTQTGTLPPNAVPSHQPTVSSPQQIWYQSTLAVQRVSKNEHFGNYTCFINNSQTQNGIPVDFTLTSENAPFAPGTPELVLATSRSMTVRWRRGWDGGLAQTFTLYYSNKRILPASWNNVSSIPDNPERMQITRIVHEYIEPLENYTFYVVAQNSIGKNQSLEQSFRSKARPVLDVSPGDIVLYISEGYADVAWTLSGKVDYIVVVVCIANTQTCNQTTIITNTSGGSDVSRVSLPPGGSAYIFTCHLYYGGELADSTTIHGKAIPDSQQIGPIAGGVTGALLAIAVIGIIVVLLIKKRTTTGQQKSNSGLLKKRSKEANTPTFDNTNAFGDDIFSHGSSRGTTDVSDSSCDIPMGNGAIYSQVHKDAKTLNKAIIGESIEYAQPMTGRKKTKHTLIDESSIDREEDHRSANDIETLLVENDMYTESKIGQDTVQQAEIGYGPVYAEVGNDMAHAKRHQTSSKNVGKPLIAPRPKTTKTTGMAKTDGFVYHIAI